MAPAPTPARAIDMNSPALISGSDRGGGGGLRPLRFWHALGRRGGYPNSQDPQGVRVQRGRAGGDHGADRAREVGSEPPPEQSLALSRARLADARAPDGPRRVRGARLGGEAQASADADRRNGAARRR